MNLNDLWQQYGAAHPILSHLLVALVAPYLISKAEGAIPLVVDWLEERQQGLLQKAGLTEAQLLAVEEHEASDLEAAARELRARIEKRRSALTPPPPPAP